MRVEFVACFEAIVHVSWLLNLVSMLNNIARPLRIYYDSVVIIFFPKND